MIVFAFVIVKDSLDSVSACLVMRSDSQALITLLAQGGSGDVTHRAVLRTDQL